MPLTIPFVRHAETEMNTGQKLVRGQSDPPLDAQGVQETQQLAASFRGKPLHYVITSPLQRAQATGQAIASATGAKLIVAPQLLPWNTGVHTGRTEEEAKPDLLHAMMNPEQPVEGGEAYGEFYKRTRDFTHQLLDLVKRYPSTSLAVVSHSRNLAAMPSILSNGEEPIEYGSKGSPPPSSITPVSLDPASGRWTIQKGGSPNAPVTPGVRTDTATRPDNGRGVA